MSELLGKLRAHMYKLDKRSAAGEAGSAVLTSQLGQLATRVAVLEHESSGMRGLQPVPGLGGGAMNPLFFDGNGSPQVRGSTEEQWLSSCTENVFHCVKPIDMPVYQFHIFKCMFDYCAMLPMLMK